MGLRLKSLREGPPYPIPVVLILQCDAVFCDGPSKPTPTEQQYDDGNNYVDQYRHAMTDGWKESPPGTFFCPSCSGKKRAGDDGQARLL
jgi:hypothetical protein